MAILEISIVPLGSAATGISEYVAGCLQELEKSCGDVRYELTAMGTIIEGELDVILAIARKMHEVPFRKGAKRVLTTLRIDDRRDIMASIEQKKSSVQAKLPL
ncbi:MAG: MTH1187 family thiamine-binding protein [Bacillota bacterium]